MVNISKSTPYVRYRENISSSLHLGTIHVKSEYLDRTKPTTIESIHGMTWHNRIFNQNRELPLLSNESITLTDKHREYYDTGEKRVPIDVITANENCVANEDGTYTYEVRSYESDYQESYDGVNYFKVDSKQLHGEMEITYNTNEEDILGSLVIDDTMGGKNQIENSKDGVLERAVISGKTLVNNVLDDSKDTEYIVLGEGINTNKSMASVDGTIEGEARSAILKGNTLVNLAQKFGYAYTWEGSSIDENNIVTADASIGSGYRWCHNPLNIGLIKPSSQYTVVIEVFENTLDYPMEVCYGGLNGTTYGVCFNNLQGIPLSFVGTLKLLATSKENVGIQDQKLTTHVRFTNDNTSGIIKYRVSILEGDYTNVDIPYFEGMQSVKMPVLKTTGKNILNENICEWEQGSIGGINGELSNANNRIRTKEFIPIQNAKFVTQTLGKMALRFYDVNKNFIYSVTFNGFIKSGDVFSVPSNAYYLKTVVAKNSDELIVPNDITSMKSMIEYNTVMSDYEPHKSNILSTPSDLELRGTGNVKDELNLLNGKLTQRIDEVIFDGSEDWQTHDTTTTNTVRYYLGGAVQNAKPFSEDDGVCDKIPYRRIYDVDEVGVTLTKVSGHCYLRSTIRDLSEFKTWLQSNPITVQYRLATESIKTVDLSCVDQDGTTQPNKVNT